ncbi:MAG TPA: ATP-binding protein [Myxococcota bacterium]|nr:ATP-binding protein [Myxococcota bacterium]
MLRFDVAELSLGAAPPAEGGDWRSVDLPDAWTLPRRARATVGWYRVEFSLAEAPSGLWALSVAALHPNAEVWLNGEILGRVGHVEAPGAQHWRLPFYASVPRSLLRAGRNRIEIRFATRPDTFGVVGGIELGPSAILQPAHEHEAFVDGTLAQVFAIVALTMAAVLALATARRDAPQELRWFAAGLALWAIASFDAFGQEIPLPPAGWSWLRSVAFHGFLPCLALGFRRGLARPFGRGDRVLLGLVGLQGLVRALVPPLFAVATDVAWLAVDFAVAFYVLRLVAEAARRRLLLGGHFLVWVGLLAIVAALLDLVSLFAGRPIMGIGLFALLPPLAILAGLALQSVRLGEALSESRHANLELERRVAQKSAELERNYAHTRRLEAERAVAAERERLLGDMHDGLGGHLVSMLALVEGDGAPAAQVADGLRGALDELRLLIDSLDPTEPDLLPVLAGLRSRLEPRLARAGLRFDWRVQDVPQLREFGPRQVLQVLRIVQEAITNVAKHAGARTIAVHTGEAPGLDGRRGVFVEVRDDGRGIDPAPRPGRGLSSMRRRAEELGGALEVGPVPEGGTCVRLWIPL